MNSLFELYIVEPLDIWHGYQRFVFSPDVSRRFRRMYSCVWREPRGVKGPEHPQCNLEKSLFLKRWTSSLSTIILLPSWWQIPLLLPSHAFLEKASDLKVNGYYHIPVNGFISRCPPTVITAYPSTVTTACPSTVMTVCP